MDMQTIHVNDPVDESNDDDMGDGTDDDMDDDQNHAQMMTSMIIPDNCHFFYTDKIFGAQNLHPSACKSGQIGFRDKIA